LLGSLVKTDDGLIFEILVVAVLDTTEGELTMRTREIFQFIVALSTDRIMLVGAAHK
jgi:hypothetical protein